MSFVSQKEAMATDVQGTADHEVQQEGAYHEEGSTLSSYQAQEAGGQEAIPKGEELEADAQKGDDPERANIQQLVQLSEDLCKTLLTTLKADEDQALDVHYRGRRHEVEHSASRRSSRSGSSCSPLGIEIEVEGRHQQQQKTGSKPRSRRNAAEPKTSKTPRCVEALRYTTDMGR